MNYSALTSEIGPKKVKSDSQGLEYVKKYNSITDYGKIKSTEGFSNLYGENAVDKTTSSEIDKLLSLQREYQKKLSNYSNTYNLLMSNINQYFQLKKSPLLNKNIRLSDGKIGYVTSEGIFKHYPSMEIFNDTAGKRNCPKQFTQVEATIVDGKVTTSPPFIVGEPMVSEQSCGHEGKNVFASGTGTPGPHVYKGCYKAPQDSDYFSYQKGLGETATFESCKQLAHDTGSSVFALTGDPKDKSKCYTGSSIDTLRTNGTSLTHEISWKTPGNVEAISALFNNAGQLIVKGNITTSTKSNLQPGLTFKLYREYMNDNVNFFKSASLIKQGVSTVFSSISSATRNGSDNTSTKISFELVGYLKSTISSNYPFSLNTDDCSYMWIGDNALSNYTRENAFINNGGRHPPRKITNNIFLDNNKYYPIRIQFGQNTGGATFSLTMPRFNVAILTTPNPFSSNIVLPQDSIKTIGDIWQSSKPFEKCNPEYGGKINVNNLRGSWGYNCNWISNPTGNKWNVPVGNETEGLIAAVKNSTGDSLNYTIGEKFQTDPAQGCPKGFSVYYKCGDGEGKYTNINGEAGGKIVNLDCTKETKSCRLFLVVRDDGNLVIDTFERKTVWSSNTLNLIGIPDVNRISQKGKYKRNYMMPGETLEDGEFIGSPTGKCFLTMIKGRGLMLMYNKSNCQQINGKMYGTDELSNENITAASYVIPENDLSNYYKTGYVDRNSILRQYGDKLLTKSNAYAEVGNFRLDGASTKTIKTNDLNNCKNECSNDSNCDGFTFGNNMCDLRSSASMFPNVKRYTDPNVSLYKRLTNVKNNASCSKEVIPVSVEQYSSYVQGDEMTPSVTCGLGIYNKEHYQKLNTDLTQLQKTVNQINERLSQMSTTDKNILAEYGLTESKLNKDIFSIQDMKNKFIEFKPQLDTVKGMELNSEDDMMSSSYYNILWSILAIMIVIGGIKMSK